MTTQQQAEWNALEERLKTILPEQYQDNYEELKPTPMGSAGLKFGEDGKVAWDAIWGSFCDLAMAGGPPHKGKLLEPGSATEIEAQPKQYRNVIVEICRGIAMVTGLGAEASPVPGWVRVECFTEAMAGWLARAITMENVAVRLEGRLLDLPASPAYRLEKEIKNVITVIAKTCHYWLDHMWPKQHREIGEVFSKMAMESPLIQPGREDAALRERILSGIEQTTGMHPAERTSPGWVGVECTDVRAAIWMMRAMVASNVLARREDSLLFIPVNRDVDPSGEIIIRTVSRVHSFAVGRNLP